MASVTQRARRRPRNGARELRDGQKSAELHQEKRSAEDEHKDSCIVRKVHDVDVDCVIKL